VTKCERLPNELSLQWLEVPFGYVETQPIFEQALPFEEIAGKKEITEGPAYLSEGREICAYRFRDLYRKRASLTFAEPIPRNSSEIVKPDVFPPFGIPTPLRSLPKGMVPRGFLYQPGEETFYSADSNGLKWYVFGGRNDYQNLLHSIFEYSKFLGTLWRENPFYYLPPVSDEAMRPELTPRLNLQEANDEIGKYLSWLAGYDPELSENASNAVVFSSAPIRNEFAHYNAESGKFVFLPRLIQMLKDRKYESVTSILVHEKAHRLEAEEGLAIPSRELLHRAIGHFIKNLMSEFSESFEKSPRQTWLNSMESIFPETILEGLHAISRPEFWRLLGICALQDSIHQLIFEHFTAGDLSENEIQARARQYAYAANQAPHPDFLRMQNEVLEGIDQRWRHLARVFPPQWLRHSMEYYFMATHTRDAPIQSEKSLDALRLLGDDVMSRWDCASQVRDDCADSSSWKELKRASGTKKRATDKP